MQRSITVYALLIFSQAASLALGLWLESRFMGSLAAREPIVNATNAVAVNAAGAALTARSVVPVRPAMAMRVMAFFWIAGLQAIVAYLVLARMRAESSREQIRTASESLRRQGDLLRTRDAVIFGLAKLAESRDPETGHHLERIALYSTRLATALHRHPRFREQVSSSFIKLIGISSALHDIGKVGVQDAILLKPGELTPDERRAMQTHAGIGGQCIREIELRLGSSNFLQMAREISLSHHERWDGSGYPRGLAGEEIPLAARIVAVVDVFDALSSKRVYKQAYPHKECVRIISNEAGKQFDPEIVAAFLEIEADFAAIARRCADSVENPEESAAEHAADEATVAAPPLPVLAFPAPANLPLTGCDALGG